MRFGLGCRHGMLADAKKSSVRRNFLVLEFSFFAQCGAVSDEKQDPALRDELRYHSDALANPNTDGQAVSDCSGTRVARDSACRAGSE